jgi:hypothetical protein
MKIKLLLNKKGNHKTFYSYFMRKYKTNNHLLPYNSSQNKNYTSIKIHNVVATSSIQWQQIPFLSNCRVSNICWTWQTTASVLVGVLEMGRLRLPSRKASHHVTAEPKDVDKPTLRLVESLWAAPTLTGNLTSCSTSPRLVKYGFETWTEFHVQKFYYSDTISGC